MKKKMKASKNEAVEPKQRKGCLRGILIAIGVCFLLFALIAIFSDTDSTTESKQDPPKTAQTSENPTDKDSEGQQDNSANSETSGSQFNKSDLSNYMGKTLSDMERILDITFVDMSEHPNFENTYRVYQRKTALFDCVVDDKQTVTTVRLLDSGKKDYSLCGITSDMSKADAIKILSALGATQITDDMWQYGEETTAITHSTFSWTLEYNSKALAEAVLEKKSTEAFSYQFEDSVGKYYIGNGQIVELISDSFAAVSYEYKQATAYQAELLDTKYDGRYMLAEGEITGVGKDGKIELYCIDENAGKDGVLHLPSGNAKISLVHAQQDVLGKLSAGDTIQIFGQFQAGSRSGIFADTYDLYNGILLSINGNETLIPYIDEYIPGITTYGASVEPPVIDTGKTHIDYSEYDLYHYQNTYYSIEHGYSVELLVLPGDTQYHFNLNWDDGRSDSGIVKPGVSSTLDGGTIVLLDLETNGAITVNLDGISETLWY